MATIRASLRQRVEGAIYDAFSDGYDKLYAIYEDDKLDECAKT
jgi:hypothetical protein